MCLHSLTRLIIGHVHVLTCMCPHQQLHVLTHMQHDTLSSRIVVPLAEELPSSRVPKPDFSRVRPVSVSWCFGRPSCCGRRPGAPAAPWRDILIYRRNNGPFTALFGIHTRGRGFFLFFPFWCLQQFLSKKVCSLISLLELGFACPLDLLSAPVISSLPSRAGCSGAFSRTRSFPLLHRPR